MCQLERLTPVDELRAVKERPLLVTVPILADKNDVATEAFRATIQLAMATVFFQSTLWSTP